jgi:hypothetical protein
MNCMVKVTISIFLFTKEKERMSRYIMKKQKVYDKIVVL